jgi:histone acetyltransferase (RNA polymerase elongator complex component)
LSTRPDYIDEKILETLKKYGVKTIELGLQSASDDVLCKCKRGHDFYAEKKACALIREYGFDLVGQMMIGLPDSTLEKEINTAKFIVESGAIATRIYPTVVLQKTELKDFCIKKSYTPLTLEDAVYRSKEVAKIFINNNVNILRLGLCASENLVSEETYFAGPNHSALGELVYNEIYYDILVGLIDGKSIETDGKNLIIEAPKGVSSKVIGQKRKNIYRLQRRYKFSNIRIIENCAFNEYKIKIQISE